MTRRSFALTVASLLAAFGIGQKRDPYGCPQCGRTQHYCCPNLNCTCWTKLRPGELPQRVTEIEDVLACPYCGYAAHIDYWFERDMERWS